MIWDPKMLMSLCNIESHQVNKSTELSIIYFVFFSFLSNQAEGNPQILNRRILN